MTLGSIQLSSFAYPLSLCNYWALMDIGLVSMLDMCFWPHGQLCGPADLHSVLCNADQFLIRSVPAAPHELGPAGLRMWRKHLWGICCFLWVTALCSWRIYGQWYRASCTVHLPAASHDLQPHLEGTGDYFNAYCRTTPKERAQNRNRSGFSSFWFRQTTGSVLSCLLLISRPGCTKQGRVYNWQSTFVARVQLTLRRGKTVKGHIHRKRTEETGFSLQGNLWGTSKCYHCMCARNGLGRLEEKL